MGKIRIKTLGDEQLEQEAREKRERQLEAKKTKKTVKAPGMKGGERIVAVGGEISEEMTTPTLEKSSEKEKKKKKAKRAKKRVISARYMANLGLFKKDQIYPLDEAIELLKKFKKTKFDETVELHIGVSEKGISGKISLPHGTGKQLRIRIADDKLISEVETGKIDFDVLVATPAIMSKLAKVAKILGPRGLMPNPKAGTISDKPEELIEKLSKGQVNYKTESQAPVIHMSVGKLSFDEKMLEENIKSVLESIGSNKIQAATLKSTMSPGIKISVS